MEKKCVSINEIQKEIERLIRDNFEDSKLDDNFNVNDSLSDRLDSMAICLLIVQLEDIYRIQFPIENFCKNDSTATLAEKVYKIWVTKD